MEIFEGEDDPYKFALYSTYYHDFQKKPMSFMESIEAQFPGTTYAL